MDREAIGHVCVILITTICLTCSYDLQCPDPSHWKLRARAKCGNITTYKCLYDDNNEYYVENCTKPDIEAAGYKLVWRGNLDRASCRKNRYQPFIFYTTESSDCSLQKSKCKGEGQLVYDLGTTSEDIQCRCNSTLGYAFVHKPIDPCFCVPSDEDCTCFKKTWLEPLTLSQNYSCQNQSNQKDSCSSTYDKKDITTMRANSTALYNSKSENEARFMTIRICITVITVIVSRLQTDVKCVDIRIGSDDEGCLTKAIDKVFLNATKLL